MKLNFGEESDVKEGAVQVAGCWRGIQSVVREKAEGRSAEMAIDTLEVAMWSEA